MRPQKRVHRRTAKQLDKEFTRQGVEGTPTPAVGPRSTPRYDGLPRLDLKYGLSRHMQEVQQHRKLRSERVGTEAEHAARTANRMALVELARAERARRQ